MALKHNRNLSFPLVIIKTPFSLLFKMETSTGFKTEGQTSYLLMTLLASWELNHIPLAPLPQGEPAESAFRAFLYT